MPFLLLLLLWTAAEIALMFRVSEWLGGSSLLIWIIVAGLLGGALIRRQGLRTIQALRESSSRGELPALAMIETMIVLVAGLLLILPGLISDGLALLLLIGPRRHLAKRLISGIAQARPDLKQPVTLEGEFQRKAQSSLKRDP